MFDKEIINNINPEANPEYQAAYDMRAVMINSLFEILQSANSNFLRGEVEKYFWGLNLIRRRINPYINAEEIKTLDEMEKSLMPIIGLWGENFSSLEEKNPVLFAKLNRTIPSIPLKVRDYDKTIMAFLKKYGFLIPPKSDSTKLIG